MPERAKFNARRLILFRLVIDLLREAYATRYDDEKFGSHADRMLLVLAVAIGQIEGRPMTGSKIAHYVGIPRVTALRKLDELQAAGVVSKTIRKCFIIPSLDARYPQRLRAIDAMERKVHEASTALSKMDNQIIARRPVK